MTKSVEAQKTYYDRRWAEMTWANHLQMERAATILRLLRCTGGRGPRILDLGCGGGWLTAILDQFGPSTGIDLSGAAMAEARERHPQIEFLAGDVFAMELEKEAYDIVVSQEVLEHVEDQGGYLDLAADRLKPGGWLILTTPNAWVQARRSPAELEAWGLQPIENWVDRRALAVLLRRRFRVESMTTILPGIGAGGVLMFMNSTKLSRFLRACRLGGFFDRVRCGLGMGLHLAALARKR